MSIKLVVFNMAGTTVNHGVALAFQKAGGVLYIITG
jgi:hypothetical protein